MKNKRQYKILDIIKMHDVETHESFRISFRITALM